MSIVKKGNPFKKSKGIEQTVIKGLQQTGKAERDGGRMYASDAGMCGRKSVLLGMSADGLIETVPYEQSAASALYMGTGEAIHTIVTNSLFKQDRILFTEFKLPPIGINLGGRVDAIVLEDEKLHGLEIKSCGSLPSRIKDGHLEQATIYSSILGLPMILLYVSRKVANYDGTVEMKSFSLVPTDSEKRAVLMQVALGQIGYQSKLLPPKPGRFAKESDCAYCPFQLTCWKHPEQTDSFEVNAKQFKSMLDEANQIVDDILAGTEKRRAGILKHIQRHGTEAARSILKGRWSDLT